MSTVPALQQEYHIVYYPPKSEKDGNRTFYITVLTLCLCIGGLPMILIFAFGINAVLAFIVAAICAAIFLFGIQPILVKKAGHRTEITFSATDIRVEPMDQPAFRLPLSECTYRWYEYSGSDEADLAGIEVFPPEGLPLKIERKYALEGDFEALLKEFKRQKI